jgi:uncharacterized protein (TIGR02246 family)
LVLVFVGVSLLATLVSSQAKSGSAADEAAIKKIQDTRVAAWNKHDAKAVAATFAEDADRVTATQTASGRAAIEKDYAANFAVAYKAATLQVSSTKVRFLSSDVALSDADIVIRGSTGGATVKQHVAGMYVKKAGAWMLEAQRVITNQ